VLGEWDAITAPLVRVVRTRGVRGFPVTIFCLAAVVMGSLLNVNPTGHHLVRRYADEYARLHFAPAALHMLPSAFVPAYKLPAWGAILQVVIIVGLAEAIYGPRVTAFVAATAHTIATLSARVFIWIGPHEWVGLAPRAAHYADSGPSGATVGLVAFVVVVERARISAALLTLFLAGEWIVPNGLAQREHVVAAAVGLGLAAVVLCLGVEMHRRTAPVPRVRCPDPRGVGL
jgi:hypothetical protein